MISFIQHVNDDCGNRLQERNLFAACIIQKSIWTDIVIGALLHPTCFSKLPKNNIPRNCKITNERLLLFFCWTWHYEDKCRKALWLRERDASWRSCKRRCQANRDFFLERNMNCCSARCGAKVRIVRIKPLTLSLPRVINIKFPLQHHQKYYITQYEGELGFSFTQMKDDYTVKFLTTSFIHFSSKGWENVLLNLGVKGLNNFTRPTREIGSQKVLNTSLYACAVPFAVVGGELGRSEKLIWSQMTGEAGAQRPRGLLDARQSRVAAFTAAERQPVRFLGLEDKALAPVLLL